MNKLVIKNLVKHYKHLRVIDGLDLECPAGKINALIGDNGTGKTTLFNLINGILRPDAGEIFYDGIDLVGKQTWQISRLGVGRLFQDTRLFKRMSVLDNVLAAFPDQSGEKLWCVFLPFSFVKKQEKEFAQSAARILSFLGIAEESHRVAEELSYGQQKLLAIARLLASQADLLLLDEPISGLSFKMKSRFLEIISKLPAEGKTILMIEHDLGVVREIADNIYVLKKGKISEIDNSANTVRTGILEKSFV